MYTIEQKVKKIIIVCLRLPENDLFLDAGLRQHLGANGKDIIAIALMLEICFNIRIPNNVLYQLNTVKDCIDTVQFTLKINQQNSEHEN